MARVTIYLSDSLHRRWRDSEWINLSKLAARSLAEVLDSEAGTETLYVCDVCRRRVGEALGVATVAPADSPGSSAQEPSARPPGGDPAEQARFGRVGGGHALPGAHRGQNGASAA